MSTGKRLAKRSIIGTRVVAPREDGLFHSAVIHAVKSTKEEGGEARYSVRFDDTRAISVFLDSELIGPGFQSVGSVVLKPGQRVYLTFNGREVTGEVKHHDTDVDEVDVVICPPGHENGLDLRKRLEEVRLLESRKSARLMDQDTDFARLADMAGDRKRTSSHVIDVPSVHGSRKRRPSYSQDDSKDGDLMNECTAALVLMRLSCSPHSPSFSGVTWPEPASPSPSLTDSWRSTTPSPPLSEGGYAPSCVDEGFIDEEFEDIPKKKKANRIVFQCTWPGCLVITTTCAAIEAHVRATHLGPKDRDEGSEMEDDHEEEFYYTEVELGLHTSSPPTLSHRDMARPPHEDPEYQRSLSQHNYASSRAINIPHHSSHWTMSAATSPNSPQKHMKLCVSAPSGKLPGSPTRKVRGETKKCRKVYGMEHRELWCTQCKWKKACSRFGD